MTVVRLLVLFGFTLHAADWLHEGTRQPLEYEIEPSNAANLKLIWKRKLGDARLSSPIIMGRLITYRGTVELVFVSSQDGHAYAVDGDFGRLFWTRQIEVGRSVCPAPAAPALTPNPRGVDPDADEEQPRRPLYVLTADAMVHSLKPIDGKDDDALRRLSCGAALVVKKNRPEILKAKRAPVIANGVAFTLDPETGELQAHEAKTHGLLYRSGPTARTTSALAVANGHVCFTASDSTLYCYGFPMER